MLDRTEMRRILMQSIVECSAPDFTKETISRGIDAGLEKIETLQIKRDGQKTFEVSAVPSGYGFWSRGGFDRLKNCGIFSLPTSPEGGPLPEMARMNEKNGRHVFHGIYQENCYMSSIRSIAKVMAVRRIVRIPFTAIWKIKAIR